MKPYMLTVQYNDDNSNDDSIRALCEQQANLGGYFLLNLRSCPKEQDPTWNTSLGFGTNLPGLIRSFAERGSPSSLRFCETSCRSRSGTRHRTIPEDWIGATVGWYFLHHVVNTVDWNIGKVRPQESRANQSGVTEEIVPDISN